MAVILTGQPHRPGHLFDGKVTSPGWGRFTERRREVEGG
jgi:hypothetical protein